MPTLRTPDDRFVEVPGYPFEPVCCFGDSDPIPQLAQIIVGAVAAG